MCRKFTSKYMDQPVKSIYNTIPKKIREKLKELNIL